MCLYCSALESEPALCMEWDTAGRLSASIPRITMEKVKENLQLWTCMIIILLKRKCGFWF